MDEKNNNGRKQELPPFKQILFAEEEIRSRVRELAYKISEDYRGLDLVMVGVLTGCVYFFTDLSRQVDLPMLVDFIDLGHISKSASQKGIVRITKDLEVDISGKHVILVEDIIRTGLTIGYLVQNLLSRGPASIKICSLLTNPRQQIINLPIDYAGFEFDTARLIGYGLDIDNLGRNLPFIAQIE